MSNRRTALVILGMMLLMATIGLSYALWTLRERQARHPWIDPAKANPVTIAFRRPLELPALGYLPKDSQIVAGLHVAEMLQDEKVGKTLLAEPRPPLFDWLLKPIMKTSGLKLEEIDHIALGAADARQVVMVVKTRGKVSLEKIIDARPLKSSKQDGRPVYEFEVANLGSNVLLWCIDDETLVYVRGDSLTGLTTKPRKDALPPRFADVLAERLPKQSFVWAGGKPDQFAPIIFLLQVGLRGKADVGFLSETKTFTLGLTPLDGLKLNADLQMTDAKAAAKLKARLDETKIDGAKGQKAEVTGADQAEQWVSWQVHGDPATLRAWLSEKKKE